MKSVNYFFILYLGKHFQLSENLAWDKMGQYFETFKQMPEFLKVLDAIIGIQCKTTCREVGGCSMGGHTHACDALNCAKSKGYDGCWQCGDYRNCDKLKLLKKNYGYVIEENLTAIKEKGFDAVK